LGDLDNAEITFLEALDYFDLNLDACYMLANIYFRKRNAAKCKDMSFRYLEKLNTLKKNPETMRGVYFSSFADAPQIYYGLGCVAYIENDHEKMDQYFLQSFEMDACKAEKAVLVARFFLEVDLDERCVRWLTAAYRAGSRDKDIIEYLQKISTESLGEFDRFETALLKIKLFWRLKQIEKLVNCLEKLMISLGMETNLVVNSMVDLGALVYDVAEVFCLRQQWHLAEPALNLAFQIAPSLFEPEKFQQLLAGAEQ